VLTIAIGLPFRLKKSAIENLRQRRCIILD